MVCAVRSIARLTGCLVFCVIVAGPAIASPSLIGEWKLVEQTYGEGKSNLVSESAPSVRMRFFRQGSEVQARLWSGDREETGLTWPRLDDDATRSIDVLEKSFSREADRVSVRYRVAPSPGDDLTLEVTEEYRVDDGGETLRGTVRVRFLRGGEDRGSYLLHRRFEKRR